MHSRRIVLLLVSFIFSFGWVNLGLAKNYTIAPPASWIVPKTAETPAQIEKKKTEKGTYFLLSDTQLKVSTNNIESYRHFAEKVINRGGIESVSQISISFDPTFQQLILHNIDVIRGTERISQLAPKRISILQREESLESQIFDGTLTATVILNDIRVGDIIDYSYTRSGMNPVFEGVYYGSKQVQWSIPVHQFQYRILWPKDRKLFIKNHKTDLQPSIKPFSDMTEYLFTNQEIPAIKTDDYIPNWYHPYPRIQLSEASSWNQVSRWGSKLFEVPDSLPSELERAIESIEQKYESKQEKTAAALRYVQDEIRYMGIEMGANSHQPTSPNVVMDRRFGDCKDKSLLLISMLDKLDIKAQPALLHTSSQRSVSDSLPSAFAFNHAIVHVELDDEKYWLDPTRTYQNGELSKVSQADYGMALILDESTEGLSSMSSRKLEDLPRMEITQVFDLRAGNKSPGKWTVQTLYRRGNADYNRRKFSITSLESLQKDYLNYYASDYPAIQVDCEMSMQDFEEQNEVQVNECYSLPEPWHYNEGKERYEFDFSANEIYSELESSGDRIRTMPRYLSHPTHIKLTVQFLLPSVGWGFEDEEFGLNNDYVSYKSTSKYTAPALHASYEFQTRKDHVLAEDFHDYLQDIKKIRKDLSYRIFTDSLDESDSTPKTAALALEDDSEDYAFSDDEMSMFLTFGAIAFFGLFSGITLYRFLGVTPKDRNVMFKLGKKSRGRGMVGFLSILVPGLGHMYLGHLLRGIALAAFPFVAALVAFALAGGEEHGPWITSGYFLVQLFWIIYVIYDSVRIAGKQSVLQLKIYNNWSFYFLFIFTIPSLSILVPHSKDVTGQIFEAFTHRIYYIPAGSMSPTIEQGDYIIANNDTSDPFYVDHGEIVVFPSPQHPSIDLIKRVIALEGETVEVKRDQVYINGESLEEPYAFFDPDLLSRVSGMDNIRNFGPVTVPSGQLFVLGDNRYNSFDGRLWTNEVGEPLFISVDSIKGKAQSIYWSKVPDDSVSNWTERGTYRFDRIFKTIE